MHHFAAISPSCPTTFSGAPGSLPPLSSRPDSPQPPIQAATFQFAALVCRVTDSYRAVGVRNDDEIVWFFIGTHAEYDRLLATL